ncbi:chemotaxis protein CheB [Streptomyces typhae]|uniref:chemotaxis protein CheB n=1 Tax=Streptomyces typhae TaxID=2681492 RepID=UPI003CCCCAA0
MAIATSAGGLHGASVVLAGLGPGLSVPVLLVQHLDPHHRTVIAQVLSRRVRLPVKLAEQDERARPGTVYIAPPDRHLLMSEDGVLTLSDSAAVHFVRPSADLLFESVAAAYGPRVVACVLTGSGRDGASGVEAVKAHGGTVIVQDPLTAEFSGMPQAAVGTGAMDFVLPLEEIAAVIRGLVEDKRQ